MNLTTFISTHDHPSSIILLEGKRDVRPDDKPKLIALGELLASKTQHVKFRSGNASGSDQLFSKGVANVDSDRLQNILPYKGHRKKYDLAGYSIGLDEIDLTKEPEVAFLTKKNKRASGFIDQYLGGKTTGFYKKAAYLLRDTVKVTGAGNYRPATFAIFYDDIENPRSGGTGHTMHMCDEKSIPWIDQNVWMDWL